MNFTKIERERGKKESDSLLTCLHLPLCRKQQEVKREKEPKKPVIKKPLNAFMLYMKEMRAKVIAECTLKESAAINQILGRRVSDAHDRSECRLIPFPGHSVISHMRNMRGQR